jgi:tetratricopeptide (TPR) repeat protein
MGEWHRIQGAFLLKKYGKPDLAEQMFQKALDMLKSTYPERVRKNSIHASLSHAQIQQKDYLKAISAADNGLSLDPRCFYAHLRRGQGLYGINDLDRCVEEYYFALQCDPEQPEVYFCIGQVNLLRAQRSHDPNEKRELLSEAFKYFKMALDFHESGDRYYAKIHYWLGKTSLFMGSYNEAREFFETAEAVFKTVDPADVASIKTTFHLGEAHLGIGMFASSGSVTKVL